MRTMSDKRELDLDIARDIIIMVDALTPKWPLTSYTAWHIITFQTLYVAYH